MKKIILAVFALLAVNTAFAQLPNITVENVQGESFDTKTITADGVPVILSFWSTSCKPCILELDAINGLYDEWQEEAPFKVVAVSIDDARSSTRAKSFATGRGWDNYTLLFDKNQDFKRAMNVNMVPHLFILDKEGKVVYSHTSYTPGSEHELIERISALE